MDNLQYCPKIIFNKIYEYHCKYQRKLLKNICHEYHKLVICINDNHIMYNHRRGNDRDLSCKFPTYIYSFLNGVQLIRIPINYYYSNGIYCDNFD